MTKQMQNTKQLTYPDWVITVSQIILYLVTVIPLRLTHRAARTLPENLHLLRRGSLVAANHQSMVDPFFITMSLPFRTYLRILPIRFPTADHIFNDPRFNPKFFPLLSFFGCFSIGTTVRGRMESIFYIRQLLSQRKTVFLFPEGKIIEEKNVREFKDGIDFFIRDCLNVMFVRLHGFNEKGARYFAKDVRRIVYGEVFEPPPRMSVSEMRAYLESL